MYLLIINLREMKLLELNVNFKKSYANYDRHTDNK